MSKPVVWGLARGTGVLGPAQVTGIFMADFLGNHAWIVCPCDGPAPAGAAQLCSRVSM